MSLKKLLLSLSLVTFCLLPLAGCKKEEAKKAPPAAAGGDDGGAVSTPDTNQT
jgi:hypothetical protein